MSEMIECDRCKKKMYTDSRSEKGAYVKMTADDPLMGYSVFHLCRDCFEAFKKWSNWDEEE